VSRGLEHENGSVDKTAITSALVSQLVERQFPQWADLPVSRVELDGWDNTTYRLGEEFSVRLPSADGYVPQVDKEHRWLPVLAPQLPVRIPEPVARGEPEPAFPRPWSVYRWLQGEHATVERIDDLELFAHNLSAFLAALYEIESASGPAAGQHSFFRGGPLATYDADTRTSITALADTIDTAAATQVWEAALATEWCTATSAARISSSSMAASAPSSILAARRSVIPLATWRSRGRSFSATAAKHFETGSGWTVERGRGDALGLSGRR
jgi:aminoglycoside phosphotransferase (APT) family kinase protein